MVYEQKWWWIPQRYEISHKIYEEKSGRFETLHGHVQNNSKYDKMNKKYLNKYNTGYYKVFWNSFKIETVQCITLLFSNRKCPIHRGRHFAETDQKMPWEVKILPQPNFPNFETFPQLSDFTP